MSSSRTAFLFARTAKRDCILRESGLETLDSYLLPLDTFMMRSVGQIPRYFGVVVRWIPRAVLRGSSSGRALQLRFDLGQVEPAMFVLASIGGAHETVPLFVGQ